MSEAENEDSNENRRDPYLELEYKECQNSERFIGGIRFTFFAAFIVFFGTLIKAYHDVWISPGNTYGETKPFILLGISLFGSIVGAGGWIVEERITAILDVLNAHSMDLEDEMGLTRGNRMRI